MSRIRLLPEILASQVAAGEVVERPASVVKELVENSIDAGARRIEVSIRRGGISVIRVVDDGCGMDRDDALLSLERHATSKIRTANDLAAIATLGFRGEALPSIASVSRFRLTTREPEAVAGSEIIVAGGKIETVRDGGEAPGTQIEVRSLFYNLPARRKFLRSENTESRNIEHQLHLQAIGHPSIAFVYVRDERVVFQLPAAASLSERIRDLHGRELVDRLLPVEERTGAAIRIHGLIGQAGVSRPTRAQQLVFVNGRAVENAVLTAGLREGYHTALMKGQFPVTFLFLDLDPAAVDVNVHPAKREVRFRDPNSVREAIVRTIRQTLESGREEWQQQFRAPTPVAGIADPGRVPASIPTPPTAATGPGLPIPATTGSSIPATTIPATTEQLHSFQPSPNEFSTTAVSPASNWNDQQQLETPGRSRHFQIIGVLNKLYVLMENEEGLVLVDQHAAHERILFEELRRRMEEQGVPSQRLLLAQTMELAPRDAEWVERNVATLQKMGIGIESFGPNAFKIDSLPTFLDVSDPVIFVMKVIDGLKSASNGSSPMRLGEEMIAKTVCRHAVKANDPLRYLEVEKLITDLLECDLPYCCPHGRPTMIQISHSELEKKFGRKV
ncbi:MAG TPA: DNA mismatch repair endonuclease MutL [Chthoniobacterales bacterium]|jgi:DNA mismatch repair protein MutL|nr:DNA mismatch repair endonuclease MutL [Chthoniobacterales bacterium]